MSHPITSGAGHPHSAPEQRHTVSLSFGIVFLCMSVLGWLVLGAWMVVVLPRHEELFKDFEVQLSTVTVMLFRISHALHTPVGALVAFLLAAVLTGGVALLLRTRPRTGAAAALLLLLMQALLTLGAWSAAYIPLQQLMRALEQSPP